MTDLVAADNPLPQLAVPGERFGWIFQDRNLYRRRFLEPPPTPAPVPPELARRAEIARQQMPKRILISLGIGIGLATVFGCCAGVAGAASGDGGIAFGVLAMLSFAGGVAGAVGAWAVYRSAQSAFAAKQEELSQAYTHARANWDARRAEFDRQQQITIDQMFEWGAATPSPGTRRVDIVGGTTWGWEALLTV